MASLRDLGRQTEIVTVQTKDGNVDLTVRGLSARGFFSLIYRFPQIQRLMAGGNVSVDHEQLLWQVPEAIGVIIAHATCDPPVTPDDEDIANSLAAGEQLMLIQSIWKMTFPRGVQSFLAALEAISGELEGAVLSTQAQATKSPAPSKPVSATAIPQT